MRKLYIVSLIGIAALIIGLAFAEQMTFTTYYPAPAGVYNDMAVMNSLGVGTTDPQEMLHVAGSGDLILESSAAGSDVTNLYFMAGEGESDRPHFTISAGEDPGDILLFESKESSNWETIMALKSTGNVGIGTTNPGSKLDVAGKIKVADDGGAATDGMIRWNGTSQDFEGFKGDDWVSLTGAPDYDSGWVADNRNTSHTTTYNHNLGVLPSKISIWFSPTNPPTRIYPLVWPHTAENPVSTDMDENQFRMHIYGPYSLHKSWVTPDTWTNYDSGFYRVRIWK
ncbi:MAG: hypothetical protein NG712_00880 [Omnitrophica bacterium]|nr:hypothetical protein [Candidatus Omnitrophota bacterium]